ncbi:MAG: Hpt domain-containing protein, partial [Clostridia bacterium]
MRFHEVSWSDDTERTLFVEEASELLGVLEQEALADAPAIDALFRAAHTLKGSGGMIGLTEWVNTAHHLEDTLDAVREGTRSFDPDVQQQVLDTVDALRAELEGACPAPHSTEPAGASAQVWTLTWAPECLMPGVRALQAWQAVSALAPDTESDPPLDLLADWTGSVSRLRLMTPLSDEDVRRALSVLEDLVDARAEVP